MSFRPTLTLAAEPVRRGTCRPAALLAGAAGAAAERINNPVAEFAGIDKITGRITTFDVYIDETVQFGALQVTPRVCYSRPKTEEPKTDSFVEVDEITLDRKIQPHLHRLDVRREPRPQRGRARGL